MIRLSNLAQPNRNNNLSTERINTECFETLGWPWYQVYNWSVTSMGYNMPVVASLDFMHDKNSHWQSNFCALKLLSIVLLNKSLKHIETNNIKSAKRVMDWEIFNGASQYFGSLCVHLVFDLIVEITNRLHFILPTLKCLVNHYNTMHYVLARAPSSHVFKSIFLLFCC